LLQREDYVHGGSGLSEDICLHDEVEMRRQESEEVGVVKVGRAWKRPISGRAFFQFQSTSRERPKPTVTKK